MHSSGRFPSRRFTTRGGGTRFVLASVVAVLLCLAGCAGTPGRGSHTDASDAFDRPDSPTMELTKNGVQSGAETTDALQRSIESLRDDKQRMRFALASRDELARRSAIAAIEDPQELASLALESNNWRVRHAATARISDPAVLAHVALHDSARAVRRAGVERLQDSTVLLQVALTEVDPELSRLAVSKLDRHEDLRSVIEGSARSADRIEALGRLSDNEPALRLLHQDYDPDLRRAAASALPADMARAAMAGADSWLRAQLAARLPWDRQQQALLEDADPQVRSAALSTLADPLRLRDLAASARHADVRAQALTRANDPQLALERLQRDPDPEPRRVAAGLIRVDDAVLASLLAAEPDLQVRARLVARLRDQALLRELVRSSEAALRREAVRRLDDVDVAAELAHSDPSEDVRLAAIARLADRSQLEALLHRETRPALRRAIAARIGHGELLRHLSRVDPTPATRLFLAERIQEPAVYAAMASDDPHWYVRWRALAGVSDAAVLAQMGANDPHLEVRARAAARAGVECVSPALLVIHPRMDPGRSPAQQSIHDRGALAARLQQIVASLPSVEPIRLELESTLLDTPYVLHDAASGADRDSGVLWIERVNLRASTPTRVLAQMQFSGGRAERSEQFRDGYRDANGELIAVRLAQVDAVRFVGELIDALELRADQVHSEDDWLQAALDLRKD